MSVEGQMRRTAKSSERPDYNLEPTFASVVKKRK